MVVTGSSAKCACSIRITVKTSMLILCTAHWGQLNKIAESCSISVYEYFVTTERMCIRIVRHVLQSPLTGLRYVVIAVTLSALTPQLLIRQKTLNRNARYVTPDDELDHHCMGGLTRIGLASLLLLPFTTGVLPYTHLSSRVYSPVEFSANRWKRFSHMNHIFDSLAPFSTPRKTLIPFGISLFSSHACAKNHIFLSHYWTLSSPWRKWLQRPYLSRSRRLAFVCINFCTGFLILGPLIFIRGSGVTGGLYMLLAIPVRTRRAYRVACRALRSCAVGHYYCAYQRWRFVMI